MAVTLMRLSSSRLAAGAILGLALAIIAAGSWASAQPTPHAALGAAVAAGKAQGQVVANVDGAEVHERDISSAQAMARLNNALGAPAVEETRRAALTRVLESKVIVADAVRLGLFPTPAEAQQYVADIESAFSRNAKARADLTQFLAGLGMTEHQYFADANTVASYAEAFATARLRQHVTAGLQAAQATATWDRYRSDLMTRALVTIADSTLR